VFANKIKRVQACIEASSNHFQHLLEVHSDFPNALCKKSDIGKYLHYEIRDLSMKLKVK
jgi:hypothetical protein